MLDFYYYLILSALLLFTGLLGMAFHRTNLIRFLLSLQIIMLAVILSFVGFGSFMEDRAGEFCALIVLLLSIGEALLFLSVSYAYFRKTGRIEPETEEDMKG